VVYAASIHHCRPCPLREQCQWDGNATAKARQVRVLLHPLRVDPAPLRLRGIGAAEGTAAQPATAGLMLSRAQRAHSRLSGEERLARNACPPTTGRVTIKQIAHPNTLCCRARVGDGLTPRFPTTAFLLLGQLRWSAWHRMAFFPGFSSSSAFLAPHSPGSCISHTINVQF
jgi:hypothetical protein